MVRPGHVAEGQVGKGGLVGQAVARGGHHELRIVRIAVRKGGIVAVDGELGELHAAVGLFDLRIGDVHHVAHDALLGVLSLGALVADDVKVQLGDDAIGGLALEDEGVVLGLACGGGSLHLILGREGLHLAALGQRRGGNQKRKGQKQGQKLLHNRVPPI